MPDCNFTQKCYFTCDQGRNYSATNLIVFGINFVWTSYHLQPQFVAKSNMGKYRQTLFDDQLLFTGLLY